MTVRYGHLAASLLALSLAACGGGGGGSGTGEAGPSNSAGNWLTLDPSRPSVTQYEGEGVPVSVTATASRTFAAPFNVAIVDAKGLVTGDVTMTAVSATSFLTTIRTAATLGAGTHTTTLEVRVCEDEPRTCAKPFPGSPWRVPLTVQVKPKAEAAARLVLATPAVSVATYPGEAASFKIEAQLNPELTARNANIGVVDPASLTIAAPDQRTLAENGRIVFELSTATANNLAPGTYTSNLQLRMCEDDIRTCRLPIAGSPWIVPLTLTVRPATNLTALGNVDGLGSWTTYQGDAAHSGFANASFDPAAFSRRWRLPMAGNFALQFASTAIDSGRAFFVRRDQAGEWQLMAVSEDTGNTAWKVQLGDLHQVNPPAAANGRVYITSSGHEDTFLWVFDQANGALLKKLPMSSQWPSYSAPTVYGTDIYSISGYYGGAIKYSDQAGEISWSGSVPPYEGWSPAADGRYAYVYSMPDNTLIALDAADGSQAYAIGDPYPYSTYFTAAPVVLTGTGQAIVAAGKLMAFDLATHTRAWVLNTAAHGKVAYGNGTVYAFGSGGRTFEARAPATGNLLWTTADLGDDFSEVVVTRNLAFVSSASRTVAIDLATRAVVWTYPRGGVLAISRRGVLYVLSQGSELSAVNLR